MYITSNPKTKKAAKESLAEAKAAGHKGIAIHQPGPFSDVRDGKCSIEGPHYPEAHRWYAQGVVVDGVLTEIK